MDHTAVFEEQVPLTPKDLRNEIQNIDSLLEQKLQAKLEGRCSRHGYVLPGSLQILSRSMGMVEKGRFTGSILFHVQAEGQVLNPPDGLVVEGEVIRKNKMGIYVNYQDAIRIIVPRDLNIGNEEFESVAVGETVKVEIKKSRFQVNDEYILSVGLYKGRGKASAAAMAAAAPKPSAKAEAPTTTTVVALAPEEEEEEGAAEGVVAADQVPLEEEGGGLEEAEPEFPADA